MLLQQKNNKFLNLGLNLVVTSNKKLGLVVTRILYNFI